MKRKFLEDLGIEKEAIDKIMAENGKDIETAQAGLEALQGELENAKTAIGERDKQLKELKTAAGDNEELKNRISALQADNEKQKAEFAAQVKQLKIDSAVESAIRKAGGRNVKAVKALIDIDSEKISVNEKGELVGLDIEEQIKALSEAADSSFLFQGGSFSGANPGVSDGSGGEDKFPENGSYEDMAAYLESHSGNY